MNNAIERLATELMKLPNDEWTRITERWSAGLGWDVVFGPAWDEISERLAEVRCSAVTRADPDVTSDPVESVEDTAQEAA